MFGWMASWLGGDLCRTWVFLMFNFRPRALCALAKAFRMPWRSSAECAAITLSSAYCNSLIVMQLTLLLALKPVKVEESAISSVHDWNPLWQLFANEVEYGCNENGKQCGCNDASLFDPFPL